ncbi:hypothetical protein CO2235_MP20189 [Cupriavidus oxalaticus]|uniref:Uncharacterized protein n=1 Tax=Cupriavidus oxalaticus TaxID=96344 RepID=A0A976GCR6_9BURK|nr:hypothetical protein CO2235_MP20189 [Cupriavidus oxalaticus]
MQGNGVAHDCQGGDMSGQFPEAAAPQGLVIVVAVTANEPAGWEASVIQRLRASGTSRIVVRAPDAMRLPGKAGGASGGVPAQQEQQEQQACGPVTAIVDLTGELDTGWCGHAVEGVWRLCDGRGLPPGDPYHGLETHANGAGIVLELVAWKDAGVFLVDTARGYAEPCEKIPRERLAVMGASLLDGALREIRALGGLAGRAAWQGKRRACAARDPCPWRAGGACGVAGEAAGAPRRMAALALAHARARRSRGHPAQGVPAGRALDDRARRHDVCRGRARAAAAGALAWHAHVFALLG